MKPLYRGIAVAALHAAIVLSLAGKYALDRDRLPRAWAKAAPVDPNLPIRGRYVSLGLEVDAPAAASDWQTVQLAIVNGRLTATPANVRGALLIWRAGGRPWTLQQPIAFFIPEHVPDPARRAPDEELWVEVSVPKSGPPRPIRLAIRKGGALTPLNLQ